MQKHSGATPSFTSAQIIDDRHGKNPCMLTKIENVAEMSSIGSHVAGETLKYRIF